MRILFATTANIGHFGPMTPFARACAAAGHEVRVAAPASFASTVSRAGLPHAPLAEPAPGEHGPIFARLPGLPRLEADRVVINEVFAGIDARAALPTMRALVEEFRPDLVVREFAEFASFAVATGAGVPHVEVAIGLAEAGAVAFGMLDDATLDELGCTGDGLLTAPLLTVVPASLEAEPTSLEAEPTSLEAEPASLEAEPPGRPVHRFAYPVPSTTAPPPDVPGTGPLVYASFGTVAAVLPPFAGAYRSLVDALAARRVRALVTVGEAGDTTLSTVDHVRVERFVPQADVMPHASAAIGHGGFGTTMTALAAGVPTVVSPLFSLDQFLNADAVTRSGAGVAVPSPAEVGDALDRVLTDPSYATAARRLADEMAALPPVPDSVEVLTRAAR
ncbi:glycosyltransferase [Saccharothrix sp. NPDC042600]|uniref:glycosyltransferase n=1 Tax=Saccharothrix TaxID=2071 RepID=UPI0033F8A44C|nr:glycosyltransferase [Saccharothrix mutabilis subsp. capreolus]